MDAFSVVSPESCANILWKSTEKADVVADALYLTADKLYKLGLIDKICSNDTFENLENDIYSELKNLMATDIDTLTDLRYEKFRRVGY